MSYGGFSETQVLKERCILYSSGRKSFGYKHFLGFERWMDTKRLRDGKSLFVWKISLEVFFEFCSREILLYSIQYNQALNKYFFTTGNSFGKFICKLLQ